MHAFPMTQLCIGVLFKAHTHTHTQTHTATPAALQKELMRGVIHTHHPNSCPPILMPEQTAADSSRQERSQQSLVVTVQSAPERLPSLRWGREGGGRGRHASIWLPNTRLPSPPWATPSASIVPVARRSWLWRRRLNAECAELVH